ncbi:MAG: ribonuclease III [Aerococcus sp.]|nr:ribonuclease III [Aerococcus sp.]
MGISDIEALLQEFGLTIKNQKPYMTAFTHSSYANENRRQFPDIEYNERIEFLGDAVLELTVSTYIYQHFPEMPEGKLSRFRSIIVCEDSLAKRCKECGFDQWIRLGHGEEQSGARNRPSLLCDLFESVVGAIYLDLGLDAVEHFLAQTIYPKIENGTFSLQSDHKTALQEELQKNGKIDLNYQTIEQPSNENNNQFTVEVQLFGDVIGTGSGHNKKEAEQQAAKEALGKLHNND